MRNPLRDLLTPQELKALLFVCGFALAGFALHQFGLGPLLAQKSEESAKDLAEEVKNVDSLKIDIRSANLEELMQLPGIGEKRAQEIIDRRGQKQFENVNELMLIKGIGPKTWAKLKPMLLLFGSSVEIDKSGAPLTAPKPAAKKAASKPSSIPKSELTDIVNINTAGVSELCTLPGIGDVKAQAIIAFRQENGPFATIDDLVKVKGIGPKTLDKIRHRLAI